MNSSLNLPTALRTGIVSLCIIAAGACQPGSASISPARTSADIVAADTKSRIFRVADDSMQGRRAGTVGHYKMTSYIEREVKRLGLEPGGENGTFFQVVPIVSRVVDSVATKMSVNGRQLALFADFAMLKPNTTERYGVDLLAATYGSVYGGRAGDSLGVLTASEAAGKIVILDAPIGDNGQPTGVVGTPGAISISRYPTAAAIAIASLDLATPAAAAGYHMRSNVVAERPGAARRPPAFVITSAVAREILGGPLLSMQKGTQGKPLTAAARFIDQPLDTPTRNVVAIIRGSDPQLRNEYVAVGAHSDHIGIATRAVDHDSLRANYRVLRPEGAQRRGAMAGDPTPEQKERIRQLTDSLRRIRPPRLDSINNGADDDGSGSVALLEIAESLANGPRPRRSILLIWHTAEEGGLLGSAYFTNNPTVPRESIISQLNMDMVGRGGPEDIAGGGPTYLQVVGSRRLSSALGDVLDSVNANRSERFNIDYSWDAPGHVMARYCRSDHYMYARKGIPIAYISRGYHPDYHVVTDEPQYINYDGLARVARFVRDVATALAMRDDRPALDKPVQNPLLPCRQ